MKMLFFNHKIWLKVKGILKSRQNNHLEVELKEQRRLELKKQRKSELKRQQKAELKRQQKAELKEQQKVELKELKKLRGLLEGKAVVMWMQSYPPHIVRGFRDVSGFNLIYWLNMLESWHKHRYSISDPYPCIDVHEEYLTVRQGQRHTVGQPKQANNTIYMLGSHITFGMYVLDCHTSSSALQRRCEMAFPNRYKVENLGFAGNNIWIDLIKFYDLQLNYGDFVILQIDYSHFAKQMASLCESLVALNRICQFHGVQFVILIVPGSKQIVNPSKIERELSCLTYQQLVSGVSEVDKRVRLWTKLPMLAELQSQGCLVEDLTPYFARPHRMGEVFIDKVHMLPSAYDEISRVIFEKYVDNHYELTHVNKPVVYQARSENDTSDAIFLECEEFSYHATRIRIAQNRLMEARELIEDALVKYPSVKIFNEALRLSFLIGDYTWCVKIMDYMEKAGIEISMLHKRKLFFGLSKLKDAYSTFKQESRFYLSSLELQFVRNMEAIEQRGNRILIVASSGPGDEIRFAKLYHSFSRILSDCSLCITCDPRLSGLLERSYPSISFCPTHRASRGFSPTTDFTRYNMLPNPGLSAIFDNNSWEVAKASDSVADYLDLLGDIINGYESFDGKPYLNADPVKVDDMRQRFSHIKKPLVGVSWRSSLSNYNRSEHYFLIDEIIDLFAVEGIQFVNLQYDSYAWELEKVEISHPGQLLHFSDIDQYNDFESTAALMECMDLIIAPATTVIELAGALGRSAWLLSNSAELHWRKNPLADDRDVWHNSVEHVEGIIGSKSTLIESLINKLEFWMKERTYRAN